MPVTLTEEQQLALQVLEWLFDEGDRYRATGRTAVLVQFFLRRLCESTNPIRIFDHETSDRGQRTRLILDGVCRAAQGLDIPFSVNFARSTIQRTGAVPMGATHTLFSGDWRRRFRIPRISSTPLSYTPVEAPEPIPKPTPKSIWDHLRESVESEGTK